MHRVIAVSVILVLAGCAAQPGTPVTLPAGSAPAPGIVDEAVTVGQDIAAFYRRPQAGQPAAAARAIAEIEWLAATLPMSPRWSTIGGSGMTQLQLARNEARAALGIPPGAPAQSVINGLAAASTALAANDSAGVARALPRATFPLGPEETVRRLSAPPQNRSIMAALASLSAARRGGGG
ncbi:hypothetical protein [Neoroseomonas rubea]|uniref:hypothetical protein n=1 Tax=Neoroseomonas rubea TaxID=2748666 RepID=UPI0018E03184|nr:hypothetical protein [Roseomonas rubea]